MPPTKPSRSPRTPLPPSRAAVADAEAGFIADWSEVQPLLPRDGVVRGSKSGRVTTDPADDEDVPLGFGYLTRKINKACGQSMETEHGKRTALGIALMVIAVLLSGSIIVLVNVIKAHPDSNLYGAINNFNDRLRHPNNDGGVDIISDTRGGDPGDHGGGRPVVVVDTPAVGTKVPTMAPVAIRPPTVPPSASGKPVVSPTLAPGGGDDTADGPGPKPTLSPTNYDPLAPTRKPSPDPNATKKPSGKVTTADATDVDEEEEEEEEREGEREGGRGPPRRTPRQRRSRTSAWPTPG